MRIVIVGAGEVGYYLAKRLIAEDHAITMIESDPERYRRASETLDAIVVPGNGASVQALQAAETAKSDILLAVSGSDEVNILACMIAKELGVAKCVARVRNDEFSRPDSPVRPSMFGIDLMIHPEQTAAREIVRLVERSSASKIIEFERGRLQIMGIYIKEDSPFVNQSMEDIGQQYAEPDFLCLCIYRDGETIIPHGTNSFRSGDVIYLIAKKKDMPQLSKIVGYDEKEQQHVMILGAGQVGGRVAAILANDMDVKLIEIDREIAETVAESMQEVLVLEGDGTDVDFLVSEKVGDTDTFVAVTGNEKTNLLSGLLALYLGVKRVIVHLTTHEYLPVIHKIGIDAVVSKNIATVNAIMKYIRRGHIIAVNLFEEIDAEAIEVVARQDSQITRKTIQNSTLPADLIIGAVIRDGEMIIPRGDTQIQARDKVVVFVKPKSIHKVDKYFS